MFYLDIGQQLSFRTSKLGSLGMHTLTFLGKNNDITTWYLVRCKEMSETNIGYINLCEFINQFVIYHNNFNASNEKPKLRHQALLDMPV